MKALIIDGGIIGASAAWRLALEGIKVTVLERARLGREASWAAAGLIGPQAEAEEPGPFFDLCVRGPVKGRKPAIDLEQFSSARFRERRALEGRP